MLRQFLWLQKAAYKKEKLSDRGFTFGLVSLCHGDVSLWVKLLENLAFAVNRTMWCRGVIVVLCAMSPVVWPSILDDLADFVERRASNSGV